MTEVVRTIANHVRAEYSHCGVEVGATGERSLTLLLPASLQVSELCSDLWNLFNATCELKQDQHSTGSALVVWVDTASQHNDPTTYTVAAKRSSRMCCNSFAAFIPIVMAAAMHIMVNEMYIHDANATETRWWHAIYNVSSILA
jgi:hypothetical protein